MPSPFEILMLAEMIAKSDDLPRPFGDYSEAQKEVYFGKALELWERTKSYLKLHGYED